MTTVTLARNAMATRFEVVLHGGNAPSLRAAGEAALDEVERLENQLSLYRPQSEIAQLNARAARGPVRVSPEVFALLLQARELSLATQGAFDITIGPLVRCWGFMGGQGRMPSETEVAAALERTGMHRVQFDPREREVRFEREGVMIDLGAIGKGFAVERAALWLREAGVESAIIHGGTSTICAIGHPPERDCWPVAIDLALEWQRRFGLSETQAAAPVPPELRERKPLVVRLRDSSLSVSAASGRQFQHGGNTYGHVLDPRTGRPAGGAWLSAVELPSATETDALSTALLTGGLEGWERIIRLRQGMKALVAGAAERGVQTMAQGW